MFIYICHPIKDNKEKNIEEITNIVRKINLTMPSVVPLTNYIADCMALDDNIEEERLRGLYNDRKLLESGIVDELWVFGDKISDGMQMEIETAKKMGIPIRYLGEKWEKNLERFSKNYKHGGLLDEV